MKWKAFFINFKRLSGAKNCLRTECASLKPETYLEALRSQSRTLTTYLRYSVNYYLKKAPSPIFEWVLNTPLKPFPLPLHYSFLDISRSYLCISSSMYIAITFIFIATKKNSHGMQSKPSFFLNPSIVWVIISIIKLDCWILFHKKDGFRGIFRYAWKFLRRCLWKHRYLPQVKLHSIRKNSCYPFLHLVNLP